MTSHDIAVRLLGSIRDHLTTYPVNAEIYSVQAYTGHGRSIAVHLSHDQLPELAAGLLAWADTLAHVKATAWRFLYGDNVHLRITGQLPDGIWIEVYGAITYTDTLLGVELERDSRLHLPSEVLRAWAAGEDPVTP